MDSPQYLIDEIYGTTIWSFKPYYKWIVLNTFSGLDSQATRELF